MDQTIYYILGGLFAVYIFIAMYNKKQGRRRKSRGFMEGRRLRDRHDDPDESRDNR